ncbi:MAG: ammonium transporter [Chloroflexi bacterium]|nr:ammonium transporter [Chloroflexota bacterium]
MFKFDKKRWIRVLLVGMSMGLLMVFSSSAMAQEETAVTTDQIVIQIDTIWLFIGAFLVFWMQAGFAMVESGFSRSKNAANLLMKNLMDFCMGTLLFFAIGFGLMYGTSAGGFIGTTNFFLSELDPGAIDPYSWVDFLFQLMFAAASATIVSGAVAERLKFKSYLVYSVVMTAFIYPISGHWHWGGGWLFNLGFIDFAGSTIVHAVGGFAALAAAWVLGPRIGKFNKDGSSNVIPGHSLTLAALGVFILWMGWFGFNSGSTLSGMNPGIAYIAVTTTLAAAASTTSALLVNWFKAGHPSTEMALNGSLAGLVAITAGAANVTPTGAILIGFIAGGVLVYGLDLIERVLKVDDPVGAVAVHGLNGMWGTIAVGLFAAPSVGLLTGMGEISGLLYGGGFAQLGVQVLGTVVIAAWAFVTMGALFYIMKVTMGIRVSPKEELEGLDISEHFTSSYPEFGPAAADVVTITSGD